MIYLLYYWFSFCAILYVVMFHALLILLKKFFLQEKYLENISRENISSNKNSFKKYFLTTREYFLKERNYFSK